MNQFLKFYIGCIAVMAVSVIFSGYCEAMEGPDEVVLDSLAQYYEPVSFDHAMHVEATEENCSVCHHHTTGTPPNEERCLKCHKNSGEADVVACQDCHVADPFDAEYLKKIEADHTLHHDDKVGLKGAYHLRCMGCHEEMGAPVGCQECHARNDAGDKVFHAGQYTPPPGKKPFNDRMHGADSHGGGSHGGDAHGGGH